MDTSSLNSGSDGAVMTRETWKASPENKIMNSNADRPQMRWICISPWVRCVLGLAAVQYCELEGQNQLMAPTLRAPSA